MQLQLSPIANAELAFEATCLDASKQRMPFAA